MSTAWSFLGKSIGVLAWAAAATFAWAWLYATMWLWFVVPLGVPAIGKAHAYGLALIPSALLWPLARNDKETKTAERIGASIALFITTLIVAYITHRVMS